jgi:hypothetical protein|tara:strand:+ start:1290 stop:1688 length:399 start_codon:yes stop_codon:yes gene_type:complete
MKKILDIFKKKEKEIEYEVVKSRSGLPIHILPLPDGINFDIEEEPEKEGNIMSEDYNKTSLDKLKRRLSEWLDWNMTLLEEEPEFEIKSEGKKLFIKVTEKGGRDIDNVKDYFMVLESLKDENEMNEEIETE